MMSPYEVYTFILCLIVFLMLGGLSVAMLLHLYKLTGRLIDLGAEDEEITMEYQKKATARKTKIWTILDRAVSVFLLMAICIAFAFSVYMQVSEDKAPNGIPSLKVVKSPSMSYIHEENQVLAQLGIGDQIQMYDLIVTHHLPQEMELQLYDIVLYEADGISIIHRIVDIEEPNDKRPDCRYFILQGDANGVPDRIPVYYSQMKGIYQGERLPFVGSFVMFMQSPAGWMCIILVVVVSLAAPLMGKKLERRKQNRLAVLGICLEANEFAKTKTEATTSLKENA